MNNASNREERQRIRRLLWRWGRVTTYCARRHGDILAFKELIESVSDVRPQDMTGTPKGTTFSDPTVRSAERMAMLEELYNERIAELTDGIEHELLFAGSMDDAMRELSPVEAAVIDLRYKRQLSYEKIADELNYSKRNVEQIEGAAITKIEKNISFS